MLMPGTSSEGVLDDRSQQSILIPNRFASISELIYKYILNNKCLTK